MYSNIRNAINSIVHIHLPYILFTVVVQNVNKIYMQLTIEKKNRPNKKKHTIIKFDLIKFEIALCFLLH